MAESLERAITVLSGRPPTAKTPGSGRISSWFSYPPFLLVLQGAPSTRSTNVQTTHPDRRHRRQTAAR